MAKRQPQRRLLQPMPYTGHGVPDPVTGDKRGNSGDSGRGPGATGSVRSCPSANSGAARSGQCNEQRARHTRVRTTRDRGACM